MTHLLFAPSAWRHYVEPASANLAGTWGRGREGVTFVRRDVRTADGGLIGAIGTARFTSTATVRWMRRAGSENVTPIANITIARNVMSLTRVEEDGQERSACGSRPGHRGNADLPALGPGSGGR